MANIFDSVKMFKPKKSAFDLSHDVKLSCNMGELIPTAIVPTVPGDKFRISTEALIRLQALISPMMHRVNVSFHTFFVPNRILWPNWDKFITNTKVGGTLPAMPMVQLSNDNTVPTNPSFTRLCDYLGMPSPFDVDYQGQEEVSALPFAAYQKVFDEYYRDENLVSEVLPETGLPDGVIADFSALSDALKTLRKRAWGHDYFTSALPFAQKGDPVTLPLIGAGADKIQVWSNNLDDGAIQNTAGTDPAVWIADGVSDPDPILGDRLIIKGSDIDASSATINDLRRAFKVQEWLERMARGGSRLYETILAHFGVRSSDARLQRPEYITGNVSPIVISEVLNTTGTDERPQGDMAGHGISVVDAKNGNYYCEEHGHIITIMSVLPKTAYQQGISRHWLKTDPTEFFWPSFANLGEQAIENRELYAYQATSADTFGYIPRYAEYKFENNRVAGDFRTTLNHYHMGRIFEAQPALNSAFITADPTHRVFAVIDTDEQKLLCHVYNKITAVRPMPKYGTPTF